MRKKMCGVFLLTMFIFGVVLTGCGKDVKKESEETASLDKNKAGTTPHEEVKGEITFSAWGSDAEIETDKEVVKAFIEEYPNVTVDFEPINDDYQTKIETMMLAGEAPDVIYGHPKYFQKWASQDLLLDLTDYYNNTPDLFDEDTYATNLYDAFTYEGKNISTINGADTFLMFYNKDLFDEAGVPYPTSEWTWDDFLNACEKLTIDKDGDGEIDQYAITPGTSQGAIETWMAAFGGELYDDVNNPTKVLVKSEENKEALQMWYDVIFKHGYSPDAEGSEVVTGGFDGGQIAMDIDGVYQCVFRSGVDFNMGLAALPMQNENSHYVSLMAGYAVPKTTKYPEAAWALASFMQQKKGQEILASTGLITTIDKKVASSDEVINMKGAPDNHILRVSSLDDAVNMDAKLPNWQETLDTVWQPAIDALYNGDKTVDETLDTLQSGLEKMLSE
jgi:multiple sugar transport system substrate-binding protein